MIEWMQPQLRIETEKQAKKENDRLEKLAKSNIHQYANEMVEPWVGMDDDLAMLRKILLKYKKKTGKTIRLIDFFRMEKEIRIKVPEWFSEGMEAFIESHGEDAGELRFFKSCHVWMDQRPESEFEKAKKWEKELKTNKKSGKKKN